MTNIDIHNLLTGLALLLISILIYVFRKKIVKNAPEKSSMWHYSKEQRINKLAIIILFTFTLGVVLIFIALF
jgi:hypothetical protein